MDPKPVYPVLPDWPIDKDIYTGFWVNRSLGGFRAATITLDQSAWNLFIAFVALFVGATARSLWKLVRFTFHHAHSTGIASDGIHNQRQAVLRNTSLATDAAVQALEISHVWRHRAKGRFGGRLRALTLLGIAVAISLLTTAASFFSSKLFERTTSEVLISGRHCGTLPFGYPINMTLQVGRTMDYNSQKSWEDYSYATRCYTNASAAGCDIFATPALPYTSDSNAPCPFAPELCKLGYGNLLLDTGKIDSLKHLGINKGPRFTLRYRTQCAPVVTRNFTTVPRIQNTTRTFVMYNFGENRDYGGATHWVERNDRSVMTYTGAYKLRHVDEYDYNFIPQLAEANGLVSLIFLEAAEIKYYYKTHDPWFSATTPIFNYNTALNATEAEEAAKNGMYFADDVQVLGCATERFFCNPARPDLECINTFGRNKSVYAIEKAWPNPRDQYQVYPFLVATYQHAVAKGQPDAFYDLVSAPILLARNTMVGNEQTALLPSNQWQLEREHIFKVTLAAWQSSMVAYARGGWWGHLSCNSEFQCERMCHSQRIRSASFHSISTWILVIFLLSGIIFMIAVLYLEELFDLLLDRTPLGKNEQLKRGHAEWKAGSTLQLQRLAHENLGLDFWKRTDGAVPVTTKDAVLGVFNIADKKHARLELPQAETKSLTPHSSILAVEALNEEVVGGADLGEGRLNVHGRLQYQRIPSVEHGSTW